MKANRRSLNKDDHAGITTYVLLMFGMAFILYLFGFQTIFQSYTGTTPAGTAPISGAANITNGSGGSIPITDPNMNIGSWFINFIMNPIALATVSIGALIGGFIIFRLLGAGTTYFQFVIPAMILMALNIFVFPVQGISNETSSLDIAGFPITVFLIVFFNLFYILAAIDFIRGPTG